MLCARAAGVVGEQLPVVRIGGRRDHAADGHVLVRPHSVVAVPERDGRRPFHRLLQTPAVFPGERPSLTARHVPDSVIADIHAVQLRELVLPVVVAVAVSLGGENRSKGAHGICVPLRGGHVPAPVVLVDPGRARGAGGRIVGIVHPRQLIHSGAHGDRGLSHQCIITEGVNHVLTALQEYFPCHCFILHKKMVSTKNYFYKTKAPISRCPN